MRSLSARIVTLNQTETSASSTTFPIKSAESAIHTSSLLNLGFSHQVEIEPLEGITFEVPDQTTIIVMGINKQTVGQQAAVIRDKRPPEPYGGKGVRYENEYVRRKAGKAKATTGE